MQFFTSYSQAFKSSFAKQTYAAAHLHHLQSPMNVDTTGCYKIFYFLTGNKKFHIDDYVYDIRPGDLFLVNQKQWHYISLDVPTEDHERFVFFLYPDFLASVSTRQSNLSSCFMHDPENPKHRISLSLSDQETFLNFIRKFSDSCEFGQDLLDHCTLLELLIFVNRIFRNSPPPILTTSANDTLFLVKSEQIKKILIYIDEHITEDLSLAVLSGKYFLNATYLCRLFKENTGMTIQKYITAKRITLAKDYLAKGYSVTDSCHLSGFRDYNGFLKSFLTSVGISPKKYAQLNKS